MLCCMEISKTPGTYQIACHNWGGGEAVSASATLSYDGGVIHLGFSVEEPELRRMVWTDNGQVWTDSCVEFFSRPEGVDEYVNLEFSASGHFLAARGSGRAGRVFLDEAHRAAVSTPLVKILENNNKRSRWSLDVDVDLVRLFDLAEAPSVLWFNIYKCGDGLKKPHFISLFPIDTPEPDFHRPESFSCASLV